MADPRRLFELFHAHGVEYVVIDRVAAALHGIPVLAASTAVCPLDTPENNGKLAAALNEIHPELRLPDQSLSVVVDSGLLVRDRRHLGIGYGISFATDYGVVDLIYNPLTVENASQ